MAKRDWKGARTVVNGTDRWRTIRNMSRIYQDALIEGGYSVEKEKETGVINILPGKKTHILSLIYAIAAAIELAGYYDFPFITEPWENIQIGLSFIFARLGIKEMENAVKSKIGS